MSQDGPVTVVVRHRVKPGRERDFETWMRGITEAATKFPGQQGFHIIRPTDLGRPEYIVFFRFDSVEHLDAWDRSDVRQRCLDQLSELSLDDATRERHTGMEVWFTPKIGRAAAPRWKMMVATFIALYPLVLGSQWLASLHLTTWSLPLRALATTAPLIVIMTYAAMPAVTAILSGWLYPPPKP